MRKRVQILASLAGIVAAAAPSIAQPPAPLDLQVVLTGTAATSLNGSANAEFDGVAVIPNESAAYVFDSIGTLDGIITTNGPAVFATEAQLAGSSASAGDLDADATNLYVSTFAGSGQRIWRIPHVSGFASAAEMVDSSGALTSQMDEIEVDSNNSRLVITYNDVFGAATEDIVQVPLASTNATPALIVSESDIETALSSITGYGDDTTDDLNVHDLTVQSDGDIIVSHGFSSNRQVNGSLLRVTETGTVSVFRTADQIITANGFDPSTVDIGSVNVEALSDDQILIHVQFTSNSGVMSPFIAVVTADGSSQSRLATESELAGDTDAAGLVPVGQFLFRMDGKGGDVATDDDYYFYRQSPSNAAAESAVLRLTGVRSRLNASVQDWSIYE